MDRDASDSRSHSGLRGVVAENRAHARALGGVDPPGHARGVVGEAVAAVGRKQDDAAVSAEASMEIGDGVGSDLFWAAAGEDAVGGPLTEDQLHDGLSPPGEGDGGAGVVRVAAAADER